MQNTIHGSLTGNFFTRHVSRTLAEILPSKTKRMFYMGSILALVLHDRQPSPEILEKVNEPLNVTNNSIMMQLPAYFAESIWKDVDLKTKTMCHVDIAKGIRVCEVGEMDRWRIGAIFAMSCPEWMQYGSDQLMASDVHDMLGIIGKAQA